MRRSTTILAAAAMAGALVLRFAGTALAVDAPRWVAAIYVDAQRAVGMRWNPVPGATGYKVLRSQTAGSGHAEIASTAQPQHFDNTVEPGETYFYVLQAVAGAETSPNSDEKSVTIPGMKVEKAKAPTWAKVVPQETTEFGKTSYRVGLVWNRVPNAIAYNVYRSQTPGKDHQMISSVAETQYADTAVELGKTYYYTLTALDATFQESPRSAEEKVLIEQQKKVRKQKIKLKVAPRAAKVLWQKSRGEESLKFDFFEPFDVDYDPDRNRLFLVSNNTYEVYVLDARTGAMITKFGSKGKDPGQFGDPLGTTLDGEGNVVIIDQARGVAVVYDQDGKFLREIVPDLPADYKTKYPTGPKLVDVVVSAKTDEYFISDFASKQILVLDERGRLQRMLATPGTDAAIASPTYMRFNDEGHLVVIDMAAVKIVTLNPDDGSLVYSWGTRKAAVDAFLFIGGFDFDKAGNIVITDRSSSMIRGFLPDSRYLYNVADEKAEKGADVFTPKTVAIDRKTDTVFVVEGLVNRVQAIRMTGETPGPQGELGETE